MRYYVLLLGFMATLAAAGCQAAPAAPPAPAQVELGEAFTLAAGRSANIVGEPLTPEFDQVLEDSRCPRQVNCSWTGQAPYPESPAATPFGDYRAVLLVSKN
ncbi:MAG: hypothetical protein WAM92_17170 [Mycobacterium sp.]